ncbi:hypothetical protein DEV92_107152 [Phyllobacterium myrsinacearum]|nr:hypothetical protein DEV92_107152 [Phyllobacterium myrsinacearum]
MDGNGVRNVVGLTHSIQSDSERMGELVRDLLQILRNVNDCTICIVRNKSGYEYRVPHQPIGLVLTVRAGHVDDVEHLILTDCHSITWPQHALEPGGTKLLSAKFDNNQHRARRGHTAEPQVPALYNSGRRPNTRPYRDNVIQWMPSLVVPRSRLCGTGNRSVAALCGHCRDSQSVHIAHEPDHCTSGIGSNWQLLYANGFDRDDIIVRLAGRRPDSGIAPGAGIVKGLERSNRQLGRVVAGPRRNARFGTPFEYRCACFQD